MDHQKHSKLKSKRGTKCSDKALESLSRVQNQFLTTNRQRSSESSRSQKVNADKEVCSEEVECSDSIVVAQIDKNCAEQSEAANEQNHLTQFAGITFVKEKNNKRSNSPSMEPQNNQNSNQSDDSSDFG